MKIALFALVAITSLVAIEPLTAAPSPDVTTFNRLGSQTTLRFQAMDGIDSYTIWSASNLNSSFTLNTNFSLKPVGQPEFVVDNPTATISGSWTLTSSATDRFGSDYRYKGPGTGSAYLQFTPNLPFAGTYDVYTWHSQGSNRSTNAPHVIVYSGGSNTVTINQQTSGGQWNLLGRYNFAAGSSGYVRITDAFTGTNLVVIADAIRFVGVGLPANTTNILAFQDFEWRATEATPQNFYSVHGSVMSSNALLNSIVLNRLSYGPTPDDLAWVSTNGADAYIDQQLNFELLTETVTNSHTNISFIETKFPYATDIVDFVYGGQTYSTNTNTGVITTNNIYTSTNATIADLKAWHVLRAVGAKAQLLEVILQWLENHFVTQYSKSVAYLDGKYTDNGTAEDRLATQFEFLENDNWRKALMNPQCTFYDLLKISAESPAMIIYLDTVDSKGQSGNIPNENYARELMELFTMGVDNGYDQNDITVMSRCWAGWTVAKVLQQDAFNPFATNLLTLSASNSTNAAGVWAFNYRTDRQNASNQVIFPNKVVPSRFGPPWTTQVYGTNASAGNYQLFVRGRSGTNGIQEGYDVIKHLANLPFTEEFISVKLCRLFVHDNFEHGTYDYTNPNLSDEAKLVRDCMLAWESSSPKGQIRPVLQTIFNSSLFRSPSAARQKVKTPLEFCVSAIRAIRASTNGTFLPGSYSSDTDGYSISGSSAGATSYPLNRMGAMLLFDRNDPNGYPEDAPGWISGGTLAERIRFVQSFLMSTGDSSKTDSISGGNKNVSDPVALLRAKLPPSSLTNASDVTTFFMTHLYPGEGLGNLETYRQIGINFLNIADDSITSSPFSALSTTSTTYDTRVRGLVSILMSFQRFNEQ